MSAAASQVIGKVRWAYYPIGVDGGKLMLPSQRKIQFICLFAFLGLLCSPTQSGFAQNAGTADPPPLNIDNNFFVTGDYVVAGAYNMTSQFENRAGTLYAVGTINVPDTNPGIKPSIITNTNQVPAGAQIVAALLYWQAVEKIGATPGQTGQNGFFRPVLKDSTGKVLNIGPAAPGYPISGVSLTSGGTNTVSWSSGGCTSGSTGKVIRTYRSSVLGALPVDSKGNIIVNGQDSNITYGTYELRLPSSTSTTPITLGATLVIIYRVQSPNVPLSVITIYSGDFAPSGTTLTTTQDLQGFYDAATDLSKHPNAVLQSRLTHIVGNGKSKKMEFVSLNGAPLQSLYPGQPPFPGSYGTWDNPTWTFDPNKTYFPNIPNPVVEGSSLVTTQVVPASMQQGCVSWGAMIFSTTVNDPDGDGILKRWKSDQGYMDVITGQHVNLTGAAPNQKDVFIQLDYIVDQNSPFSPYAPNSDAVRMVKDMFSCVPGTGGCSVDHKVHLHINPADMLQPVRSIPQQACVDSPNSNPQSFCSYPNQLVTTWRAGFELLKNQPLNYPDETSCETRTPPNGTPGTGPVCLRQFPPAQKDSHYHLIFGNALGQARWTLGDRTLTSVSVSNGTVTFATSMPHGLAGQGNLDPMDTYCGPNGRVTIVDAITDSNLNGIFCILDFPSDSTFRIQNAKAKVTSATRFTDPNLAVFPGHADKRSGESDKGGAGSMVTLGKWGPDGQTKNTQAGTLAHEIGHLFGLGHGGQYPDPLNPPYGVVSEPNCKSNYQSVMSYANQVDLFQKVVGGVTFDVPDFSGQELITLTEDSLGSVSSLKATNGSDPTYSVTRWYTPIAPFVSIPFFGNIPVGSPANHYCDGVLFSAGTPLRPMYRLEGPVVSGVWTNGWDIDFNFDPNRSTSAPLRGFDDWKNIDLRLRGASASAYVIGGGGGLPSGGGGLPSGGGGLPSGGGGLPSGGGGLPSGGGGLPSGGGGLPSGGGGLPSGGGTAGHFTLEDANSATRPPRNLIATEDASPRHIHLFWNPPTFGTIGAYRIYRQPPFTTGNFVTKPVDQLTFHSDTNQYEYEDTTATCVPSGYTYFVSALLAPDNTQESPASNTVSTGSNGPVPGQGALTGCYTLSAFSSPSSAFHGSIVQIKWTLQDDFNTANFSVNRAAANTSLVAIGPVSSSCGLTGSPTILLNGTPTPQISNGQFTFNWDTDAFCAGSYTFQLTLDSGQTQTTTSALQLQIDVTDTDSTPHIATASLADATVGVAYSNTLTADGGVGALTWSVTSGSLPPGIVFNPGTHTLQGAPTVPPPGGLNFTAQLYNFTVQVTDSAVPANVGTQALTLRVITAVSLSRRDYPTGTGPIGLIAADFNGDGKPDLASANSGDNTVSVLLGNGDGAFTSIPALATGSVPFSLTAGDFNGDGKLDLAVANFASGAPSTVSIFLGNGDGTFQAPATYAVGSGPISVITGDFNGDTKLDLAVANQNDHSVSVLLGNGDGTFQPQMVSLTGGSDVAAVVTGDFDGDGKLDLALTNPSSDTVSVLLGNGDGTFQAAVAYATGNSGDHPIAVSAVDFNGDGELDLAVTNLNARTVAILLGNGKGTFNPRVTYPTTNGLSIGPSAMNTGDFNSDGKVDLAITDQHDNTVSILLGNGDGTFQSPLEFTTGNFAAGVAAGDFNGDGRLDLAVADFNSNTVSVMLHLPQPPTNITVSGVTTGQVALTWTPSLSTTIAGYNVYRGTTSGGPYMKINSAPVTASGFTDITAVSGPTYYYVVTSVDPGSLESVFSNEVSATTP